MMCRLMVDHSLGFLYAAKQTRRFPSVLMMFIARQLLASMTILVKFREVWLFQRSHLCFNLLQDEPSMIWLQTIKEEND